MLVVLVVVLVVIVVGMVVDCSGVAKVFVCDILLSRVLLCRTELWN